jgi:RNA polymerase sigma-70 factor (sigma-E family)
MRGDSEFRDFVSARSPEFLRLAWMLTGDAGKAEDLLQASLARLWPRWPKILEGGAPDGYLRAVMINLATAWGRRRWNFEVPTESLPEQAVAIDMTSVADEREALQRVLSGLPRRQRAVVVLRYYEGLSEREVAEILGCSLGTVKSQASRGLDKLRDALQSSLTGSECD